MTEEELRKQAVSTVEWENTPVLDRPLFVHAYITGAKLRENRIEELEKENAELRNIAEFQQHSNMSRYFENKQLKDENAELKAQNKKMQNVGNCKHAMDCAEFNEKEFIYGKLRTCKNCKDWELAE